MVSVVPGTQRRWDQRRGAGGGELEAPRPRTHPEAGLPDRVLPVGRKPGARCLPAQTRPAQQTGICQRQAAHFIQKGNARAAVVFLYPENTQLTTTVSPRHGSASDSGSQTQVILVLVPSSDNSQQANFTLYTEAPTAGSLHAAT